MTRAERAREYFKSGLNCSQSVLLAFSEDTGLAEDTAKAISRPLGGGMGRLRQTCGAVSGAALASGLLFPDLSKSEAYALVQEIARREHQLRGTAHGRGAESGYRAAGGSAYGGVL